MIEDMKAAATRLQNAPVTPLPAGRTLDVVALWPELFDGLDDRQRNAIRQACAANWHEGWNPNRADVADLTENARGRLSGEEYMQRARDRHAAARAHAAI